VGSADKQICGHTDTVKTATTTVARNKFVLRRS
jgi:hypothetical protein